MLNHIFSQDATQPVVLAPASAAHAHAEAAVAKHGPPTPLIRFGVVRSFANSLVSSAADSGSAPSSPVGGASAVRRDGDILSFRSLYLEIGEIDVQTDGAALPSPGWLGSNKDCNMRMIYGSAIDLHSDMPAYVMYAALLILS
jgi:hypothetical protein